MNIEGKFEKLDEVSFGEINKIISSRAKAINAMNEIHLALKFGLTDEDKLEKVRKIEESFRDLNPETPTKKKETFEYSPDLNRGDEDHF